MNKILIIVCLFFVIKSQSQESFEGIIQYRNMFKSKVDSISNEALLKAYGEQTKYLLSKDGDYINLFKGSYITIQLYKKDELKLYTLLTKRDTIFYNDVRQELGTLKELSIKSVKEESILGYPCKIRKFELNDIKYTYYYSDDIYVDKSLFNDHNFGKWNEIIEITKSIPLKVIIENNIFTMESIATSVKKGKVDKRLFNLPPNSPTKKADNNLFITKKGD